MIIVLWEELIEGERNHDQGIVIQGLLIFLFLAIFSFYMEFFVDLFTFISIVSLFICQFINLKEKKYKTMQDEAYMRPLSVTLETYFYEFSMMLFILVFSNILPKAGHFIMFWAGPLLGVKVPTLHLDLSFSGIWSIFEIEFEVLETIDLSLLILSFILSLFFGFSAKTNKTI